ncbi:hypothetical protein TUM4438_08550 [Shewanella sairae]|uniref:Phage shock protein B n=1 Tax=Shewanella sairae TaxID=190310 RepID=A0ABQ4P492_9GAMM|nr:hypothetical protein [Shewanella sairae]GIU42303.1 hypothetical protein TUM4438_08550 [Shewanella sairae]
MSWLVWVSFVALFIGLWHEVNRFPITNKSILKLSEKLDELEAENRLLQNKVESLSEESIAFQ